LQPNSSKPRFSETWASVSLDLVRGLAAILVLVDHWRHVFFVDFHELGAPSLWFAAAYGLTNAGGPGVVIFFVLSGFLIGGTVRRAFDRGQWSWASYLTHRLVRLWIVLLPGLLLCLLWDTIGSFYGVAIHWVRDHSARAFVGNMLFLQGTLVPTYGSDGPLWSLANEFWYYILFPLGLASILPSTPHRTRCVSLILLILTCLWLRTTLLKMFPIWFFGAALVGIPVPRLSKLLRWMAAAGYALIVLLCTFMRGTSSLAADYILAAGTAIFIWTLLSATEIVPAHATRVRFSRSLARFSYSLYVLHFPFLILIAGLLLPGRRWQPASTDALTAIGVLLAIIAYAYAIATLTEFQTLRVRSWLEQRLGLASTRD
jgi:peptidoglycan/LPS O-acetylase OafA/YrhL